MNVHFADERPTERLPDLKKGEARLFSRSKTVLSKAMTSAQEAWLLDYACTRWDSLFSGLSHWRVNLARFERMADDNYEDRKMPDPGLTDATDSVFKRQNFTLGMAAGFADFVYAQARDDIFGTRPWLAATPESAGALELADTITKNAQWKLNQSNLEATLLDSIRGAVALGTMFVKCRWLDDVETYETAEDCAHSIKTGQPILDAAGDYITIPEHVPEGTDPTDVEWREILIENADTVYRNIEASCLDFKNVAFDMTAAELDLRCTDFLHRFEVGVHDLCNECEFDDDTRRELVNLVDIEENVTARDHRQEQTADLTNPHRYDSAANPRVTLVEGFLRCSPLGDGKLKRVSVVFSPSLRIMFRCEYLAADTPRGVLPVFPVRCFKTPGRITGKGYFEKYEDANTAVDGQYNSVTLHNRKSSEVIKGVKRSAFADNLKGQDLVLDPDKLYEIAEDKTLAEGVQFVVLPDIDNRSVELLNQMNQAHQSRSGISSAAQGELKGLPQSNTATGVNQIISRGAVLLKWPISQMTRDITAPVSFSVHCHYANHDHDETFVWGEGKDAELLELKKDDVKNLRAKVTLTMSQSQSQEKLSAAQVGIGIGGTYAMLPETEKQSQRRLFIQALSSLGFQDADRIIREAAVTPEGILAILPPDMQAAFAAFLQSGAIAAPIDGAGLPPETIPETSPVQPATSIPPTPL